MNIVKQRKDRSYQVKHRGSRRSYRTEAEDALILLAWEAGELSEGQASKALWVDRVTARDRKIAAIERGRVLGKTLWNGNKQGTKIKRHDCEFCQHLAFCVCE